mmetsp:Transcript_24300/g.39031  ORF Transcript_24300/g.39031 Transcript_24300/m.39031 type:complete len:323 (-) Transcript_24300:115-1083(-)
MNVHSEAGRATYTKFLSKHQDVFPHYVEELRGIANGSQIAFETIFINNLFEEFSAAMPDGKDRGGIDGCSDYVVCEKTSGPCLIGHNEDNDLRDVGHAFVLETRNFIAYTYMGDLPSGAFGFNSHGVGFTLNWLGPENTVTGGLGRGFMSRSLLDAASLNAAVAKVSREGQSTGHNYQLFSQRDQRVLNVEVSPGGGGSAEQPIVSVRNLTNATPFFHANQYQTLSVPQIFSNSSIHRLARVRELPIPHNRTALLEVLGDQEDRHYPVFHDNVSHEHGDLSDWTLATALFSLRNGGKMTIFEGNPKHGDVAYETRIMPFPAL